MKKSKRTLGSNFTKIDSHVITQAEYDEAPELTAEWFANADWYEGDKLIRRGRGRPVAASKKVSIHLRVDPEVAAAFRATGKGWQTRANMVLRHWMEEQYS